MTDTELIDLMADNRIVDGIGDIDIDDATALALNGAGYDDEEAWKIEWRKQFRIAVQREFAPERAAELEGECSR